jgi:DME family drug/metabolite transporter
VLAGTSGLVSHRLVDAGAQPVSVGAVRILVGGAALLAGARWDGGLGLRRRWPALPVLAGSCGVAVFQVAFFEAVERTGVGAAAFVTAGAQPLAAGLLSVPLLGERLRPRWWAATSAALLGLAAIATGQPSGVVAVDGVALALALAAGAGFAVFTVAGKVLLRDHAPLAVPAVCVSAGGLLLLPALAGLDTAWLLRPAAVGAVLYLGLCTVAASYGLYARGLALLPASVAATLVLAEPLTAATLGLAFRVDRPTAAGLAGMALLALAVGLLARPSHGDER